MTIPQQLYRTHDSHVSKTLLVEYELGSGIKLMDILSICTAGHRRSLKNDDFDRLRAILPMKTFLRHFSTLVFESVDRDLSRISKIASRVFSHDGTKAFSTSLVI